MDQNTFGARKWGASVVHGNVIIKIKNERLR